MKKTFLRLLSGVGVAVVCLVVATPASALVLHPGFDPDDSGYTPLSDKPSDAVVGAWDPNNTNFGKASAAVIAPNYIVTTQHQGYKAGSTTLDLYIGGVRTTFQVADAERHDTADIMVARLKTLDGTPANLDSYVPIYTGGGETSYTATMAGWGQRRGDPVVSNSTEHGYYWTGPRLETLTWGRNDLDATVSGFTVTTASGSELTSEVLVSDFDPPGTLDYEAGIADSDSGGGAFIYESGQWKLAGLNAYTERRDETWYDNPNAPPPQQRPDKMWFIRVGSYQSWIDNYVSNVVVPPGDANWDGEVDESDFSILVNNWDPTGLNTNTWEMGDFDRDGLVGNEDFAIVLSNWTGSVSSLEESMATAAFVPEPATLALLAAGALVLPTRRRRNC
ncbi:MAG: dockerin type I domain-containing protein [Phycisphaerae bacterium]